MKEKQKKLIRLTDIRDRSLLPFVMLSRAVQRARQEHKMQPQNMQNSNTIEADELSVLFSFVREELAQNAGIFNHSSAPVFNLSSRPDEAPKDELYEQIQRIMRQKQIIVCPASEFAPMYSFQGYGDKDRIRQKEQEFQTIEVNNALRPVVIRPKKIKPEVFVHKSAVQQMIKERPYNHDGYISLNQIRAKTMLPIEMLVQALDNARAQKAIPNASSKKRKHYVKPDELSELFSQVRLLIVDKSGAYNHPLAPAFKLVSAEPVFSAQDQVDQQIEKAMQKHHIILCPVYDFIPLNAFRSAIDRQTIKSLEKQTIEVDGKLYPKVIVTPFRTFVCKSVEKEIANARQERYVKKFITMSDLQKRTSLSRDFLSKVLYGLRAQKGIAMTATKDKNHSITSDDLDAYFAYMRDMIIAQTGHFDEAHDIAFKITKRPREQLNDALSHAIDKTLEKHHIVLCNPKDFEPLAHYRYAKDRQSIRTLLERHEMFVDAQGNLMPKVIGNAQTQNYVMVHKQVHAQITQMRAFVENTHLVSIELLNRTSRIPTPLLMRALAKGRAAGRLPKSESALLQNTIDDRNIGELFDVLREELVEQGKRIGLPLNAHFYIPVTEHYRAPVRRREFYDFVQQKMSEHHIKVISSKAIRINDEGLLVYNQTTGNAGEDAELFKECMTSYALFGDDVKFVTVADVAARSGMSEPFVERAMRQIKRTQAPLVQFGAYPNLLAAALPTLFEQLHRNLVEENGVYQDPSAPTFKMYDSEKFTPVQDELYLQIQKEMKKHNIVMCPINEYLKLTEEEMQLLSDRVQQELRHKCFVSSARALRPCALLSITQRGYLFHKETKEMLDKQSTVISVEKIINRTQLPIRLLYTVLREAEQAHKLDKPLSGDITKFIYHDQLPELFHLIRQKTFDMAKVANKADLPAFVLTATKPDCVIKDELYNEIEKLIGKNKLVFCSTNDYEVHPVTDKATANAELEKAKKYELYTDENGNVMPKCLLTRSRNGRDVVAFLKKCQENAIPKIEQKGDDTYSCFELSKLTSVGPTLLKKLFNDGFAQKETFKCGDEVLPMFRRVKTHVLDTVLDKRALEAFKERFGKELKILPPKTSGMFIAQELADRYNIRISRIKQMLYHAYMQKLTFEDENKQTKPLVLKVKYAFTDRLALNEGALETFVRQNNLEPLSKQEALYLKNQRLINSVAKMAQAAKER